MGRLRYLNAGVAAILAFVGAKMLVERWYPITTTLSLAVIASLLALSVVASLVHRRDVAQIRPGAP
jgi:tellurite resistance protein TerC